jgi:hypothetical protein
MGMQKNLSKNYQQFERTLSKRFASPGLGLPNGPFHSGFPTELLHAFLISSMYMQYMPHPFHPP